MLNDFIQLLGLANPQLSVSWTKNGKGSPTSLPTLNADKFTLALGAGDEWVAPCGGILTIGLHHKLLQLPDGSSHAASPDDPGIVLQMAPQAYLALCRLYATIIEGTPNTSNPKRPVPKYFLFTGISRVAGGPDAGIFNAGDTLKLFGNMTIHDEEGIVIDPLAIANAFDAFWQAHATMEFKSVGSTAATAQDQRQVFQLSKTGNEELKIYFTDIFNAPFVPAQFGNITPSTPTDPIVTITNKANPITKNSGADALLQLALSTNGLFADTLSYPSTASAIHLKHDFIRVKTVNWNDHLIGNPPAEEPVKANNVMPVVRDHELISFSFTGNDCLGHVNDIVSGTADEKTIVSTDIQTDFTLPNDAGNHLWPGFSQGITTSAEDIDPSLDQQIVKMAHFITDAATNNTDVYFEIKDKDGSSLLKNGWAVRVFHRVFHPDGTETRGDGAGTIIKSKIAAFRLKDPLGINKIFTSGIVFPPKAILMVDMIVVNGANPVKSRRFGNITTAIATAQPLLQTEQDNLLVGTNTLNTIKNTGISPSGFLGVKTSANPIFPITDLKAFILASGSTSPTEQPMKAAVLPTQSRLEGMAAGKNGAAWSAVNGSLRLIKQSRENFLFLGNPGSPGGFDSHTTGLVTSGGLLAYDIARAGFRRTRLLSQRMNQLISNSDYALPVAPTAAGRDFVAVLLQNISKKTESPRLEEFQQNIANLPATKDDLATQLNQLKTNNTKPSWLPDALKDQFKAAMTAIPTINAANCDLALGELKREYVSSIFGRRDSFHAVKKAIQSARHFIYLEGSFFGPTKYPATAGGDPPDEDLIEILKQQLKAHKGLKLILCLSQEVPANRGYENIARFHLVNRDNSIARLFGTQDPVTHLFERDDQVVAFHPLGFPGRPIKVNTQVMIVDDVWAMMGSSNFSRRGFFFDGSADIACCDKNVRNGKSVSIVNLRKNLMLQYIRSNNALPGLPASNQVFMKDGRSAFEMLKSLIRGGGGTMIREIVPADLTKISTEELSALNSLADPDGDTFFQLQGQLNVLFASLSTVPE